MRERESPARFADSFSSNTNLISNQLPSLFQAADRRRVSLTASRLTWLLGLEKKIRRDRQPVCEELCLIQTSCQALATTGSNPILLVPLLSHLSPPVSSPSNTVNGLQHPCHALPRLALRGISPPFVLFFCYLAFGGSWISWPRTGIERKSQSKCKKGFKAG